MRKIIIGSEFPDIPSPESRKSSFSESPVKITKRGAEHELNTVQSIHLQNHSPMHNYQQDLKSPQAIPKLKEPFLDQFKTN